MLTYALNMGRICEICIYTQNMPKYALTNRAHFTGNFMICTHLKDIPSYLAHQKTCICIQFTALVMTPENY